MPFLAVSKTSLAPGSVTPKSDASGSWDLSGDHPLAEACVAARNGYGPVVSAVEGLVATTSIPKILLDTGESFAIPAALTCPTFERFLKPSLGKMRLDMIRTHLPYA